MESQQLIYLKEKIKHRIERIDHSKVYYRKIAFRSYMSITFLAAISTVVLGLNIEELKEVPRIVALIISSLIAIISAYNTFFDNKGMWVANNNALNELYKLKFDIEFREKQDNPINDDTIQSYKEEYQSIIDRLNKVWTESRSK